VLCHIANGALASADHFFCGASVVAAAALGRRRRRRFGVHELSTCIFFPLKYAVLASARLPNSLNISSFIFCLPIVLLLRQFGKACNASPSSTCKQKQQRELPCSRRLAAANQSTLARAKHPTNRTLLPNQMRASLQPTRDAAKTGGRVAAVARWRASVAAPVSRRAYGLSARASAFALPTPPKGQMLVRLPFFFCVCARDVDAPSNAHFAPSNRRAVVLKTTKTTTNAH
jgi:hypothetical protein